MEMKYRRLGRTGLNVSFVSLGTGGPSRLGQRTHGDEKRSHALVAEAIDLGVNLIDTAANYSDSEAILGRALQRIPRDRYYLATKFNPDPNEDGSIITPDELVAACEQSLERLKVETIDIYQFHGLVPGNYRQTVETLYPTMEQLRDEGKIRFIGVTEYFYRDPDHQMLVEALEDDVWDTIMVKYGILNMWAERDVLPRAQAQDVGVLNMSAVRKRMTRPTELERTIAQWKRDGHLADDALPEKDPLRFLVGDQASSVVAAGYKFGADHDAISSVIVGTGDVEHLRENIASILGPSLPQEDSALLRELFGHFVTSEAVE